MIDIGDKVEFNGRKGLVRGTVTDVKFSSPGRNKLARFGLTAPSHRMLTVMADDERLWSVPDSMCKKVGKGDKKAPVKAIEIISQIKQQQRDRVDRRSSSVAGLAGLKKGDPIEVKFRNSGWVKVEFSHVSSSNRVAFVDPYSGSVRFSNPQFVRRPV